MAAVFAVAYLVCVLVPATALASMVGAAVPTCLTSAHAHHAAASGSTAPPTHHPAHHDPAHHASADHDHAGAATQGSDDSEAPLPAGKAGSPVCCGSFCLSGIPAGSLPDFGAPMGVLPAAADHDLSIAGRAPGRIDRPPIVLLP